MLVSFCFNLVDYVILYGIMLCLWKIRAGHCYWFGEHLIPCIWRSCCQAEDMFLSPLSSEGSHFQLPTGTEAGKQLFLYSISIPFQCHLLTMIAWLSNNILSKVHGQMTAGEIRVNMARPRFWTENPEAGRVESLIKLHDLGQITYLPRLFKLDKLFIVCRPLEYSQHLLAY